MFVLNHVYDPESGELDLLFFLSLKKQSYLHPGGLHVTKNLRERIQHVYNLYSTDKLGRLPSVSWRTVYDSQYLLRKDFQNFLVSNNIGYTNEMTTGNTPFLTRFLVHRENTFRDNNNKRLIQGPAGNTRNKKQNQKMI